MSSRPASSALEPLVSVVIPTYNGSPFLCQAVDSALAQTYRNIEVIVVDDGSTDDTAQVAKAYGDRIHYIRQDNAGTPAARNTGIRHACGQLIALLDHDDRWLADKLALEVPLFAGDDSIGLVHGGVRVFESETGRITGESLPKQPLLDLHDLLAWCVVAAGTAVFRRAAFDAVGPFDESVPGADDWDLWIRIAAKYKVLGCPHIVAELRMHGDNQSGKLDRMYDIVRRVIDKPRNFHGRCAACRQAVRRSKARLREDYYVKACRRARAAMKRGSVLEAVGLRLRALLRHPAALTRFPRRIVEGVASPTAV